MHYLHVFIVLFSTSLYKSAYSTCAFGKLVFFFLCFGFYVSMSLVLSFYFLIYVMNSMSFLIVIVCTPSSAEGVELPTKFSKRGSLAGPQLSEGGCWETWGDIFSGRLQFSCENKLKS